MCVLCICIVSATCTCTYTSVKVMHVLCFDVASTQPSDDGNPVESGDFILSYVKKVDKAHIRCI